jgi:hypothetical protein
MASGLDSSATLTRSGAGADFAGAGAGAQLGLLGDDQERLSEEIVSRTIVACKPGARRFERLQGEMRASFSLSVIDAAIRSKVVSPLAERPPALAEHIHPVVDVHVVVVEFFPSVGDAGGFQLLTKRRAQMDAEIVMIAESMKTTSAFELTALPQHVDGIVHVNCPALGMNSRCTDQR